jgi:hypothetical protein
MFWIQIRTDLALLNPDPGVKKLTKLKNKMIHSLSKRLLYIRKYALCAITNIKYTFQVKIHIRKYAL